MGNLFTHKKNWTRPPIHEQYTNRCKKCKYLFLSPYYDKLTCPICTQQSNQSQAIESKVDSPVVQDKISD